MPMPIIHVSLLEGRSSKKKGALIRALTDAAEQTLDVRRESIRVLLHEVPAEHWGVGGVAKRRK
jgi:4-oxalocrotonate tautomerase